jgi:hypothetical protein
MQLRTAESTGTFWGSSWGESRLIGPPAWRPHAYRLEHISVLRAPVPAQVSNGCGCLWPGRHAVDGLRNAFKIRRIYQPRLYRCTSLHVGTRMPRRVSHFEVYRCLLFQMRSRGRRWPAKCLGPRDPNRTYEFRFLSRLPTRDKPYCNYSR